MVHKHPYKSGLAILFIASLWCFYIGLESFTGGIKFEDGANMLTIIVSTMTMFSFTIGFYKLSSKDKD